MQVKPMIEQGKLVIQKTKKGKYTGTVQFGNKSMPLPSFYELEDEAYNGAACEVEREKGQIQKVMVAGRELPRRDQKPGGGNVTVRDGRGRSYGSRVGNGSSHALNGAGRGGPTTDDHEVYLPRDTWQYRPDRIENFGLQLNKVAIFKKKKDDKREGSFTFYQGGKSGRGLLIDADFSSIDFTAINKRRHNVLQGLGLLVKRFSLIPRWRFVVGLGQESVYETALTLHPVYGFPYIPGSAIKGLVRNTIINEVFSGDEQLALKDEGFRLLFGWVNYKNRDGIPGNHQGLIRFFDAYPAVAPRVAADIINPHYAPYYQDNSGQKPPGDYYKPVPVFFLTVEKTEMIFYLGIKPERNETIATGELSGQDYLTTAADWLCRALCEYGIGAKTAIGYGYFNYL
ncbi:hypothetical protein MTAT_24120 [Moorella thermoacetica]|uniref:RAMP superfamily protein n=3 Tax=Neomoorella thermoacetica TaxID=1525 RepID=A0AAC9MTV0_NEOTH|nr:RAMP superfamily protein [Moorella thermoacetica]TYL10520.1 hypothetical protein MTAT_24120 [Moorella thermoacetica]GAF26191.1 uncharacterized protein MTY_1530 [Moorella thermoacetica Y72]